MRLLLILAVVAACSVQPMPDEQFKLINSTEGTTLSESLSGQDGLILVFISPECPLCKNYAPTLREIIGEAEQYNVSLAGVVSGNYYSDAEVNNYLEEYKLQMPVFKDPEFVLSKYYGAKITPEVCLLDATGSLQYRGAIDNWAISLGQKRTIISAHYLRDALSAFAERRTIDPRTTKAVGCFIE